MNYKLLKILSRKELLELLLEQANRIKELEDEKLNNKILLKDIGTLSEASFVLTNIFKEADEVVNNYIKNAEEQLKLEYLENKKFLTELKEKRIREINEQFNCIK